MGRMYLYAIVSSLLCADGRRRKTRSYPVYISLCHFFWQIRPGCPARYIHGAGADGIKPRKKTVRLAACMAKLQDYRHRVLVYGIRQLPKAFDTIIRRGRQLFSPRLPFRAHITVLRNNQSKRSASGFFVIIPEKRRSYPVVFRLSRLHWSHDKAG